MPNDGQWRWVKQEDSLDLTSILRSPGRIIKKSPQKAVTRHELPEGVFYVKRYLHSATPLRPLKFLLKETQAKNEWEAAFALRKMGAPMVEHLALGERHALWGILESVLITKEFPGVPINQWLSPDWAAVRRFVDALHEKGIFQKDLHPENILVDPDSAEMRLVDLHGIKIIKEISTAARRANLAYLRIFVPIPVDDATASLSAKLRKVAHLNRARRSLKRNRDFGVVDSGSIRWQVRQALSTVVPSTLWQDPDLFLKDKTLLLKEGRTATVGQGEGWVLKRYNLKKPLNILKDFFRNSKPVDSFLKAYHLELAGIPTARCIAAGERRLAGAVLKGYLLMEKVSGQHLGMFLQNEPHPLTVLKSAVLLIARLHQEGFSHRDLKETNLIVTPNGSVVLIDLDGLRFRGTVSDPSAAAELARFCRGVLESTSLDQPQRLALLRAYCRARNRRSVPRSS